MGFQVKERCLSMFIVPSDVGVDKNGERINTMKGKWGHSAVT